MKLDREVFSKEFCDLVMENPVAAKVYEHIHRERDHYLMFEILVKIIVDLQKLLYEAEIKEGTSRYVTTEDEEKDE